MLDARSAAPCSPPGSAVGTGVQSQQCQGHRGGPSSLSLHGLPQCRPREASKAPAPQLSPTPAQYLHDHDGINGCVQEAAGPGLVAAEIGVMEAQEEDVGWQVWESPRTTLGFVVCRESRVAGIQLWS